MKRWSSTVWTRGVVAAVASIAIALAGSAGVAVALPYPPIPAIPAIPAVLPTVAPPTAGEPGAGPAAPTTAAVVPQTLVNGRVDPGSFPVQAPTGGVNTTGDGAGVVPAAVGLGVLMCAMWILFTVRRRRTG